jgi:hypothetical protein
VLLNARRTLDGYFGRSLIGSTDPGITAPPRVDLGPGQYAIAELEWENTDATAAAVATAGAAGSSCLVRQSPTLVVTSPDSTKSSALPGLSDVCGSFDIGPALQNDAMG